MKRQRSPSPPPSPAGHQFLFGPLMPSRSPPPAQLKPSQQQFNSPSSSNKKVRSSQPQSLNQSPQPRNDFSPNSAASQASSAFSSYMNRAGFQPGPLKPSRDGSREARETQRFTPPHPLNYGSRPYPSSPAGSNQFAPITQHYMGQLPPDQLAFYQQQQQKIQLMAAAAAVAAAANPALHQPSGNAAANSASGGGSILTGFSVRSGSAGNLQQHPPY